GAYAACDHAMSQLLLNTARPFIFSTAPAPPLAAGALAALELIQAQPERGARLRANSATRRGGRHAEGLAASGSTTQNVPLVVGDAHQAMRMCELALEGGVFAQAIRPPTVPEGTSRLRLAVMASHSREELREAARVLGRAALRAAFRPGAGVPAVAAREGGAPPLAAETDTPAAA